MRRLLFLPGAAGAAEFWHGVGRRLPTEWPKSFLAWPGLGNQPPSPDVRGLADLVALAENGLADDTVVIAQSMGGVVALELALRHPTRITSLVLTATSGGLDVSGLGGADWRPAYRDLFPRAAAWITDLRRDYSDRLQEVRQPALLIWGDADPISPVAVGRLLAARLPAARLHVLPGGTHQLAEEQPEAVARLILEHLGASRGAGRPGGKTD